MRNLLHQTGNPEEMGHFLVKVHFNKMDPKIRKMQADQLAIQTCLPPLHWFSCHCPGFWGPLLPAGFHLLVLGFQDLFPVLVLLSLSWGSGTSCPAVSPLIVLGFPVLDQGSNKNRCSGAPLRSDPTQCPHVPQPRPTQ